MKEQLISFETAKLAEKKGLPRYLNSSQELTGYNLFRSVEFVLEPSSYKVHIEFPSKEEFLYAPTQSLLQKWLREKHNIITESNWCPNVKMFAPLVTNMLDTPKMFTKQNIKEYFGQRDKMFSLRQNTYEKALETALQEALKLIK